MEGGATGPPTPQPSGSNQQQQQQMQMMSYSGGGGGGNNGGSGAGVAGASSSSGSGSCKWTFVFDPAGRLCYYWSMVVSLAFLYNFWVLIYRFAFQEIGSDSSGGGGGSNVVMWLCLDYTCDLVYALDIAFHFRTGYLDEGVLQTDATKLRQHYMNSTTFYVDCLCLLPLDFLYLSLGFNSMLRCFRLVKIYRFWTFMDRTERHTNYPNVFRSISLVHYLLVIFHWNACLYRIVMKGPGPVPMPGGPTTTTSGAVASGVVGGGGGGDGAADWWPPPFDTNDGVGQYLQCFYLCTLTLTTTGGVLKPRTKGELVFVIIQLIFGLMLFAAVLGHVSNIVINVSAARKEFQGSVVSSLYCHAACLSLLSFRAHCTMDGAIRCIRVFRALNCSAQSHRIEEEEERNDRAVVVSSLIGQLFDLLVEL